ncbi:histidinol-phosphatase [Mesorhizobium sp. B2-5-9]|nr:histidinol-phosphatase [Mesorhizobium sp. B2-5-9]
MCGSNLGGLLSTDPSSGASFFRADLHIHSFGASHDVVDVSATPPAIIEAAADLGLDMIALADHNEVSNVRIAVAAGLERGVLVIPAVELSTPEGHLLCYLPTADALETFFAGLSIADRRTPHCRCQTGLFQCLQLIQQAGGFAILAHVDSVGSFEEILPTFTPAKRDIIGHAALLGFEVKVADSPVLYTDKDMDPGRRGAAQERIAHLRLGSQQFLARVLNSDSHTLAAVGRNARNDKRITRYKMERPSFEGLRLALQSSDTRVRIEDDVPLAVPRVKSVRFEGGFLDGQIINFSPNLTCIIGGRGSGKSTAFSSICLLAGASLSDESVVDSDVWPDVVSVTFTDETLAMHELVRGKFGVVENLNDPVTGLLSFPLESYGQGETNEISKRVESDPLALSVFLDRLVPVEHAIEEEDELRKNLNDMIPKIVEHEAVIARIDGYERELKLKNDQLERLRKDKGEEIIKLQQRLEGEKRARTSIEVSLRSLSTAISADAVTEVLAEIKNAVASEEIKLGATEVQQIITDTTTYEGKVTGSVTSLKATTQAYVNTIKAQITSWKSKESQTVEDIERKKKELLAAGIRLDMPFIQKLVADQARAQTNLGNAKTWIPGLAKLRADYTSLLKRRWEARSKIAMLRVGFASRASRALDGGLSDLFVTLKYDESSLSPDAERMLNEVMGWRTLQQKKAGALVSQLTVPRLLECVRRNNPDPIVALRDGEQSAIFQRNEALTLLERLTDPEILRNFETVSVHDRPKLSVTKRIAQPGGAPKHVPRDFKKLSLGQQQSVLLALMLTSESTAPLIVDQPEDNLDSEFIYKALVPVIRAAKERRQVIVVTHNANIAVLGDSELIVALKATNEKASIITRGSIDHPETREAACAILEGSREAFERRSAIYGDAPS